MVYRVFETMFGKALCFHTDRVTNEEADVLRKKLGARLTIPVGGDLSTGTAKQAEQYFADYLDAYRKSKPIASAKPGDDWYTAVNRPDGFYYCDVELGFVGPFESDSDRNIDMARTLRGKAPAFAFYLCDDNYLASDAELEKLRRHAIKKKVN